MKKLVIGGIIVALIALLVFLITYLKSVSDYQAQVAAITISDIDIQSIPDGTYTGDCDVNFIYAKAEVTVQGGRIVSIDLTEHRNGRGKAAEEIPGRIIDAQRIDVDAVTSATNSSKVIEKAVEQALLLGAP